MKLYDFDVKKSDGSKLSLKTYRKKVILIVNVASRCGFTKQYKELEQLYKDYQSKGFVVLGFPCNQFGAQESGSNKEIQNFCKTHFAVTFPVLAKINVNGPKADPIYKWLKDQKPGLFGTKFIKWNFTKFLISQKGEVVSRFASRVDPLNLRSQIEAQLNSGESG